MKVVASTMETLSSSLTFFYKFVFPGVWSAAFGLGTILIFLSPKPDVQSIRWPFAAAWILGTALLLWGCARLKRVELDGDTLVVSNYREEIGVPVRDVVDVKQNLSVNIRPITLTLRKETPFGRSISFMPRASSRIFSEDEIVTRLRSMARAGGGSTYR